MVRHWNRLSREAVPGTVEGDIGWDPGQPDLVVGDPILTEVL